jgi:hypothetical protein
VTVPQRTSGVPSLSSDDDGIFCNGQMVPGASGSSGARMVTESSAGPTVSGLSTLEMNLAGTFCIDAILDGVAGFPAVGVISVVSEVDARSLAVPSRGARALRRPPGCALGAVGRTAWIPPRKRRRCA